MNEVGRCVDVLPVLGTIAAAHDRPSARLGAPRGHLAGMDPRSE
jgi:hypothetical protein